MNWRRPGPGRQIPRRETRWPGPAATWTGAGEQKALSHGYRDFMGIRISGQAGRGGRFFGPGRRDKSRNPAAEQVS